MSCTLLLIASSRVRPTWRPLAVTDADDEDLLELEALRAVEGAKHHLIGRSSVVVLKPTGLDFPLLEGIADRLPSRVGCCDHSEVTRIRAVGNSGYGVATTAGAKSSDRPTVCN